MSDSHTLDTRSERAPLPGVRARSPRPGVLGNLARAGVLRRLGRLRGARLDIVDTDGTTLRFGTAATDGLHATIRVHDARFWGEVGYGGSIGAGESYMLGYWSSDELIDVVRVLARDLAVADQLEGGLARISTPLQRLFHRLHANTRDGSRRNIAAHYDLGNDFFALFLDPTMMYSCALFDRPQATLEEASVAKLEHICRKLELSADDRVLEIGTGWGGFAVHAARHYGCHVTTTTISRRQFEGAKQRVREAGLEDRVEVIMRDYRELEGRYDKLVSIEMIEAVGHNWLDTFFRRCSNLLEDHGMMLLQAITIADHRYRQALRGVDFIQRHVFPGGFLPSVAAIAQSVARATDLRPFHVEDIGPHYDTTLRHWRARFLARLDRVREMGYPETFVRMWDFYLCYCAGGFAERTIGDVQMLLVKPRSRREPVIAR